MDPRLQEIVAMVLGQNRENPALQGYLSAPNSRPEIESQMGLPAHLRQQPSPFGNQPPMGRVVPPQVRMSELTGNEYPFPGREPMVDDPRVERLPNRYAPPDPFERPLPRTDGPRIMQEPHDPESWRQPEGTPQIGLRNAPLPVGTAAPRRGLEPPDGPQGPTMAERDNAAWNAALATTRQRQREFLQRQQRWSRERDEDRRRGRGSLYAQLPRHPGR